MITTFEFNNSAAKKESRPRYGNTTDGMREQPSYKCFISHFIVSYIG